MVGGSKDLHSIACQSTCQVGTAIHAASFGASVETTVVRNHHVRCCTGVCGISAGFAGLSLSKIKKHISKHQHPHIAHQHTNTHTGNVSFVVTDFNFFELIRLCSHSFFPNYFCSVLWEDASKRYRTTFTHCLVITSSQTKCLPLWQGKSL